MLVVPASVWNYIGVPTIGFADNARGHVVPNSPQRGVWGSGGKMGNFPAPKSNAGASKSNRVMSLSFLALPKCVRSERLNSRSVYTTILPGVGAPRQGHRC